MTGRPPLPPVSIHEDLGRAILRMWRSGSDTLTIAQRLAEPEARICRVIADRQDATYQTRIARQAR